MTNCHILLSRINVHPKEEATTNMINAVKDTIVEGEEGTGVLSATVTMTATDGTTDQGGAYGKEEFLNKQIK